MTSSLPPFKVLFQDRRFLVIDKPAGIAAHASRHGGANVEDALRAWIGRGEGPWLAHRLDADTAGCLVLALRRSALRAAQAEFAAGRVRKTYWAVVRGHPREMQGTITAPLARAARGGRWRMEVRAEGDSALTEWRVRGVGEAIAWLELHPRTGRTHQVRAHCAALGCPILGDAVYGGGEGPLHLLARAITLDLDPPVSALAPVPEHMGVAMKRCGWS
jgi:tRNA pseudouridine32 synthase/23S rRNA pseudouridine746 synthase